MDLMDLTPAQSPIPPSRTGAAMPKSTSPTDKPSITGGGRSVTAKKTAATVLRHKEERRAESLAHIRTQTDDGSLVIRHMSEDEQAAASQAARTTRARNEARTRRYRSPGEQ
jgi:hypothetical protein